MESILVSGYIAEQSRQSSSQHGASNLSRIIEMRGTKGSVLETKQSWGELSPQKLSNDSKILEDGMQQSWGMMRGVEQTAA